MKTKKITESEISDLKIASMPSRPSAPAYYGGKGYTAEEVKAAFDRLPLFIIEKFNLLIDDILAEGGGSVAEGIKTDISPGHTLKELFADITGGALAGYLKVGETTLRDEIIAINEKLGIIAERLGISL